MGLRQDKGSQRTTVPGAGAHITLWTFTNTPEESGSFGETDSLGSADRETQGSNTYVYCCHHSCPYCPAK